MEVMVVTAAAAFATGGQGAVHAAPAPPVVVSVPCDAAELATDVAGSVAGETLSLAPNCVYDLPQGLPVVTHSLEFDGNGATLQRSYAVGTPGFAILKASGGDLTVKGLNFRNGNGAITIRRTARLTVDGGVFSDNTAAKGAAIYDRSESGGPVVTDATFFANRATTFGGAIFDVNLRDGADVTNSAFIANTADNGGAIYDFSNRSLAVTGSYFSQNSASACGALCLFAGQTITLARVTARDNSASGSAGGASLTSNQDVRVTGSQFSENHAGDLAGGLYLSAIRATVTGTVADGNSAADGAGLYTSTPFLTLTFVTISGNHASDAGAGVYNDWSGSGGPRARQARDSVIVGNSAEVGGGGIYDAVSATFTVTGSSVGGNWPDNCEPVASVTGCTG